MAPSSPFVLRVGTRASTLALAQTRQVIDRLALHHPGATFVVETIRTEGDRVQDRPISQIGDKGVFVRPMERALLEGRIDLAVHSLKDVPSDTVTAGLTLGAFLPRADPRDAFIAPGGRRFEDMPVGARVGTGSARRRTQLQVVRPDLRFVDIRGNVDTRLARLDGGEYDALVLAAAGLHRLGLEDWITEYLDPDICVPDAGQGIIGVQIVTGGRAEALVDCADDVDARAAAGAERAVVHTYGADCYSPIGALAETQGSQLRLRVAAAREDGTGLKRLEIVGDSRDPEAVGRLAGQQLYRAVKLFGG